MGKTWNNNLMKYYAISTNNKICQNIVLSEENQDGKTVYSTVYEREKKRGREEGGDWGRVYI